MAILTDQIKNLNIKVDEGERHGRHAFFVYLTLDGERSGSFEELDTIDDAAEYVEIVKNLAGDFELNNNWDVQDLRDAATERIRLAY